MKKLLSVFFVFISLFLILPNFSAFSAPLFLDSENSTGLKRSSNAGFAEEEFRRGVQSYYRGFFNAAIIQFEKALSYLPNEGLILDWLGKAYYRAGLEGVALEQWQYAINSGYGGILLENRMEIVRERRVTGAPSETEERYTEIGSFSGMNGDFMVFSQPSSVLANSDGTMWVTAYGSNELLLIDINGNVIRRITGPLNGFDRPVDVIRLNNGNLLVCESSGDRLSLLNENGLFQKYIGKKGRGVGEFVGPQYAAEDKFGNIYTTDFGNARVCVFDKDGNGLFCFGKKNADFFGLKGPTGIAIKDEIVFVADNVLGAIYKFDLSGNYIEALVEEKTFSFAEAMKFSKDENFLIVSDKNHIYSVDVQTGAIFENAFTGNAPSRITAAIPDQNGNILACDFASNEIYIMAKMTELLGGLYVEVTRVNAEQFPKVTLEVRVQNRRREDLVGLKAENFYITEDKRPVANLTFDGSASVNEKEDIVIIVDRSVRTKEYGEELNSAIKDIAKAMNGVGKIRVISSGEIPVEEYNGSPLGLENFSYNALKSKESESCAFDLAIRLGANSIINDEIKRGIIYITDGKLPYNAFNKYGLSDLTAYLNNNGISLSVIQLVPGAIDAEFDYIVKNTSGKAYYVYRPEGLSSVVQDILNIPNGLYRFSYESVLPTDMGRNFLPLEIESYIMNRSGRDETGYFAPLQ